MSEERGPDPRDIVGGTCPVCFNVISGVVYERKTLVEKGHTCGPAPKPFERSVDAYVRLELYSCGLQRSVTWKEGRWGEYSYSSKNKCANAQSMALTMRAKLDAREILEVKVYDAEKKDEISKARVEDLENVQAIPYKELANR